MDALESILALADGPEKTARVAAWVQSLFAPGEVPVLVGGAAVELFTRGAYSTGDLDFVGNVPREIAQMLAEEGFRQQGRLWIHDRGQLFVEFPSGTLQSGEVAVRLQVAGCEVLAISPEDLLAERLGAWQHWKSAVDGANALLLYRAMVGNLSMERLRVRCEVHQAGNALAALESFARRFEGSTPSEREIEDWTMSPP